MNQDKTIKAITQKYWYNANTGLFLRKKAFRDNPVGSVACSIDKRSGYRDINVKVEGKQKNIRAHRAAFLITHGHLPEVVHHVNHNRGDNRIINLREATSHTNSFSKAGTFTKRGVTEQSNGTFTASITKKPHQYNLGNYATEAEAATAYNIGARQLHGEFATLNSIDEVAGVTVELRKVGCGVGKRIAMHDEIVQFIKKKTRLCYFTGHIFKSIPDNMTKYTSSVKRWNQRTKHKQIFTNGRSFGFNGVTLTKREVVHVHQYGKLPDKKNKAAKNKSKIYNFKLSEDRTEFKKKYLKQIEYNPQTGEFKRCDVVIKSGTCSSGYLYVSAGNIRFLAHRLAYLIIHDEWPEHVDHINRNTQDNRIDNLRASSFKQNSYNKGPQKNSSSKYKGVSWNKEKGKWRVYCNNQYMGDFNCEEEAAEAYNREAKKLHGEFAYINKI